mgnify:CR=1 FL=1
MPRSFTYRLVHRDGSVTVRELEAKSRVPRAYERPFRILPSGDNWFAAVRPKYGMHRFELSRVIRADHWGPLEAEYVEVAS